jgi:hypothetical protein
VYGVCVSECEGAHTPFLTIGAGETGQETSGSECDDCLGHDILCECVRHAVESISLSLVVSPVTKGRKKSKDKFRNSKESGSLVSSWLLAAST